MNSIPPRKISDEEHLGELAMQFRGTRRDDERQEIAKDYAATVLRLIAGRQWREAPPPEDQLPDDKMPREFFDYWSGQAIP